MNELQWTLEVNCICIYRFPNIIFIPPVTLHTNGGIAQNLTVQQIIGIQNKTII